MTNQQKLILACGILLIAICAGIFYFNSKQKPETVYVEVESLRPSSIYNGESVYWYARNHKNDNEEMAKSYLDMGLVLEGSNPQKAIFNIKRAITLYPNAEYYKILGRLLDKTSQYKELAELYSLLASTTYIKTENGQEELFIFGPPNEETYYEYLAANYLNDKVMYGYFLTGAEGLGFSKAAFKKRFLADSRIKLVPGTEAYKNSMLAFMTEAEIKTYINSEENFRNFLASIKDSTSVFALDEKGIQAFEYHNMDEMDDYEGNYGIAEYFTYYLEEKQQNPDEWYAFNVNRKIRVNDSIQAILYAIDTSATACPADMRHIYHRLVTYTKKGKIIQSKVVALQSGEKISTLDFSGNHFTITDYQRSWKKAYNKEDFDNFVTKTEPAGKHDYEINGDGRIQEIELNASAEPATVSGT